MKRKLVAMLCVASMTAAMLSGCGDRSGEELSGKRGISREHGAVC